MTIDTWLVLGILVIEVIDFVVTRWEFQREFQFDRNIYEKKNKRIRKTKTRVTIEVKDGRAAIVEKPDDIDVDIQHRD